MKPFNCLKNICAKIFNMDSILESSANSGFALPPASCEKKIDTLPLSDDIESQDKPEL